MSTAAMTLTEAKQQLGEITRVRDPHRRPLRIRLRDGTERTLVVFMGALSEDAIEEAEMLADPQVLRNIRAAEADVAAGRTVTLDEAEVLLGLKPRRHRR